MAGMASLLRFSPDDAYEPSAAAVLLGWYGGDGMSLLEASLFVSLGTICYTESTSVLTARRSACRRRRTARAPAVCTRRAWGDDLCVVDELDSHSCLGVRWSGCRTLGIALR